MLSPQAFTEPVTSSGWTAVKQIRGAFKSYTGRPRGQHRRRWRTSARARGSRRAARRCPSCTNHDTDRNAGDALGYKDGDRIHLATEWLLASGYGSPQVYSSFTFGNATRRPDVTPSTTATQGSSTDTELHQRRGPATTASPRSSAWSAGTSTSAARKTALSTTTSANVIAFSRGNKGWAGFNNNTVGKTITVQDRVSRGHVLRRGHTAAGERPACAVDDRGGRRQGRATVDAAALARRWRSPGTSRALTRAARYRDPCVWAAVASVAGRVGTGTNAGTRGPGVAVLRVRSGGTDPGAGGTTLERAALVLAQAAPHAVVLARLERPLQAGVPDVASPADLLGLLDLEKAGPVFPIGKNSSGSSSRQAALWRQSMGLHSPHLSGTGARGVPGVRVESQRLTLRTSTGVKPFNYRPPAQGIRA